MAFEPAVRQRAVLFEMNRLAGFDGAMKTFVIFRSDCASEKLPDTGAKKLLRAHAEHSCALLVAIDVAPILVQYHDAIRNAAQHRPEPLFDTALSLLALAGGDQVLSPGIQFGRLMPLATRAADLKHRAKLSARATLRTDMRFVPGVAAAHAYSWPRTAGMQRPMQRKLLTCACILSKRAKAHYVCGRLPPARAGASARTSIICSRWKHCAMKPFQPTASISTSRWPAPGNGLHCVCMDSLSLRSRGVFRCRYWRGWATG